MKTLKQALEDYLTDDNYKPKRLSWAKSHTHEALEMRRLIEGNPVDVKLLMQEYYELTGEKYND